MTFWLSPQRISNLTSGKFGGVISLIALLLLGIVAMLQPPLRILSHRGRVIVDVQTLGEYSSSLSYLELTECGSGTAIWRLQSSTSPVILWAFPLQAGINPVFPDKFYQGPIPEEILAEAEPESVGKANRADYRVVVPRDLTSFTLSSGKCYRISIEPTGALGWMFRVSERFLLK